MTFEWFGRQTGPWDYAPSGPRNGDCLLPCVHLQTSTGVDTQARVFIPRREELDKRFFNGRVGFRVLEADTVTLELRTPMSVQWQSVHIELVTDFLDDTFKASDFHTQCRFFLDENQLQALKHNWGKTNWSRGLDQALDACAPFAPPATLNEARVVSSEFLKTPKPIQDNVVFWGSYLASLAMRTLVLERQSDMDQLTRWVDAMIALPFWGQSDDPKGRDHDNDLTADFHMMGLCLTLNWHAPRLGNERVEKIKDKIRYQAQQMRQWIITARSAWPGANTQNHAYFGYQTLLLAGAILLKEGDDEALDFLQIACAASKRFTANLPSDGSYHEGLGYISFGLLGLMPSLFLLEELTGQTWLPHDWLAAHFPAMNALVPTDCGKGFSIDDGDHCFPCNGALALWAWQHASQAATRQAAGQLLTKSIAKNQNSQQEYSFVNNFWCLLLCPNVTQLPNERSDSHTDKYGHTLLQAAGYFTAKLGDNRQAYFLTAPPHGHELFKRERHTYAYGHHHPDTGNVLLIDHGRWVLADSGYTYCKTSREHNVLLVDDHGQYNDGYVWMPPPPWDITPQSVRVTEHDHHVEAHVDLAYIYPCNLGLKSWQRCVYTTSNGLVVIDDISTQKPAHLTINWGSDFPWQCQHPQTWHNTADWQLTVLGDPTTIVQQTVNPARRFRKADRPWHVLRLSNTQSVTHYRVVCIFEPAHEKNNALELLQRLQIDPRNSRDQELSSVWL